MFCNKCGNQLPDESVFCSNCGAKLETAEEVVNPEPVCSSCGEKLIHGNKFCIKCGVPFQNPVLEVQTEKEYNTGYQKGINNKQIAKVAIIICVIAGSLLFIASFDILPNGKWVIFVTIIMYLSLILAIIILVKNIIIKIAIVLFSSSMILANLAGTLDILPDGAWLDVLGIIGVVAIIAAMVIGVVEVIKDAKKEKNNV